MTLEDFDAHAELDRLIGVMYKQVEDLTEEIGGEPYGTPEQRRLFMLTHNLRGNFASLHSVSRLWAHERATGRW